MKAALSVALLQALGVQAIRIVQSNDDGWAESYARTFYDALTASGHSVVLSAPAENKSGTGSLDASPQPRTTPCQYNSCPAGSGPVGTDATNPHLNWVNSYPVTSMKHGIDTFGPSVWDGAAPEFAVSGVNVGSNVFVQVPFSGTVGAAVEAVKQGIPAIAFSGGTSENAAWDANPQPKASGIYAELATTLTNKIISSGAPYLPQNVWLNVNFPKVSNKCSKASDFKFVLTRINPGVISQPDVQHCGTNRLPGETATTLLGGCYVAVSVGDAKDKTTADRKRQGEVLAKLKDILTCT